MLPARLARASERLRGVKMGDFELVREGLHLGDAKGNRFEITLRALQAGSLSDVAAAAEAVVRKGFHQLLRPAAVWHRRGSHPQVGSSCDSEFPVVF